MTYFILLILNMFFCAYLVFYIISEKTSIIKFVLEVNNIFCFLYLVCSAILIYTNAFTVEKALFVILVAEVLLSLFFTVKYRKNIQILNIVMPCLQEFLMVFSVFILCVPLVWLTTEDISSITDQGAYFTHYICHMEQKTDDITHIKELGEISENVDEGLQEIQELLVIYDYNEESDTYQIHGNGTWCVIPALFGKLFGIWNGMKSGIYIYILNIFNMLYICKKISKNGYGGTFVLLVFALSPLILYIGKAGLTENVFLLLLLSGFRYAIMNEKKYYFLGGLFIGFAGFIHLSIYVYLPIIVCICMLQSTKKESKDIALFNITQLFLFAFSFWYCHKISTVYTESQYYRFTLRGSISYPLLFTLIDLLIAAIILYQVLVYCEKDKIMNKVGILIYTHFKSLGCILMFIIIIGWIWHGYNLGFTENYYIAQGSGAGSWELRSRYCNLGIVSLSYLNIVNIARAIGPMVILCLFTIPFFAKKISDETKTYFFITIYSFFILTVIQVDTPFNYYASRYFVPVLIPMIVITVNSFIEKKGVIILLLVIGFVFNKRYYPSFLEGAPMHGQYEILQKTMNEIPEDAVVLCDTSSQFVTTRLVSNLRILNGNNVYNMKNMDEISDFYRNQEIYIISNSKLDIGASVIYADNLRSQYSFGNGNNGSYSKIVGSYNVPIYIYKTN